MRDTGPSAAFQRPRLAVVGAGMAAARFLEELLRCAPDRFDVTVFGEEPEGHYNRVMLSPVLGGESSVAEIITHAPDWHGGRGIVFHGGDPVKALDLPTRRLTTLARSVTAIYDHLVLATGAEAMMPRVPECDLAGVFGFRRTGDVAGMLGHCRPGGRAVVVGGGVLGLEAAVGLVRQGLDVTVLHRGSLLMEKQLDGAAAYLLQECLEAKGVRFELRAETRALLGAETVDAVALTDGRILPAELVVFATGIVPRTDLARAAGLRCGRGVVVDDALLTSSPEVSAIGECIEHRGQCYGLVAPGYEQARVCAQRLGGASVVYAGSTTSLKLKVTGIELFSAGEFTAGAGAEELFFRDPRRRIYKKLVVRESRLAGAVLFGDARDANWYQQLIHDQTPVASWRQQLLFGERFCQRAA